MLQMFPDASYVTRTCEEVVDAVERVWEPFDGWELSWFVVEAAITPATSDLSIVMVLPASEEI